MADENALETGEHQANAPLPPDMKTYFNDTLTLKPKEPDHDHQTAD